MRAGAVVVNYNAAAHLGPCLDSLSAAGVDAVVVADNGSADGSRAVAEARGAEWLDTGANLGYGRAANRGAAHRAVAGRPLLLVCNADVEVRPGCVSALAAALDGHPARALAGPRVINPDGSLYPSARTFPSLGDAVGHGTLGVIAPANRWTRRYRLLDWDHGAEAEVDWVSGACFLARREAWDAVGGFDPSFFMYLEDVDLCWRLCRAGWSVAYAPGAEALHVQGVSADLHPYRMLAAHHRSLWTFARRSTPGAGRAALPLVAAGLGVRLALTAGRRRLAGPARPRPLA